VAEYVIVTRNPAALNRPGVVAIVVRDDQQTIVIGDTPDARDLRERAGPHDTLATLLHGWDFHFKDGPYEVPGTAVEVAATFPVPGENQCRCLKRPPNRRSRRLRC